MEYIFREATPSDIPEIWNILKQAISRRKADGSDQWQDGYPNPGNIQNDIAKKFGYVLTDGENIVGYTAVITNDEPAYNRGSPRTTWPSYKPCARFGTDDRGSRPGTHVTRGDAE